MPRSSSLGHPGSSGIVPACVGNGTSALYAVDHPPHRITPASMGNTASPTKLETVCSGSSPRAWGTPLHTMQVQRFYGIIPACVGNTKGGSMSPCKDRDHPRVRGEHRCIQNCPRDDKGSSPRTWGTPQVKGLIDLALRIIPTCVGNTATPYGYAIIHLLVLFRAASHPSSHAPWHPGHPRPPRIHDTWSGRWHAGAGPGQCVRLRWPCRIR